MLERLTVPQGTLSGSPTEPESYARWDEPCVHVESTLHQISPYIGKMKSTIARELIERYSEPGDLVVDPFAGSFTVPLEAVLLGRQALGADISPYAYVLGQAKLFPPSSYEEAVLQAEELLRISESLPHIDLRKVPSWVRSFYHPKTLQEALKFRAACIEQNSPFFLACLLGILHHQRPGFLSYPSSHLVPYLRDKKFPRESYPELYAYRALRPRLLRKVARTYKRFSPIGDLRRSVVYSSLERLPLPQDTGCVITSPPYMNALDYGRDNRLRLWFVDRNLSEAVDPKGSRMKSRFEDLMTDLAIAVSENLRKSGYCVVVVGEQSNRTYRGSPSQTVLDVFSKSARNLQLVDAAVDNIPDIRRARRHCRGVRAEHFLVFQKQ